jgi:hypothetical protein
MGEAQSSSRSEFAGAADLERATERMRLMLEELDLLPAQSVQLEEGLAVVAEAIGSFYGIDLATSERGPLAALLQRGAERMRAEGRLDLRDRMEAVASLSRLVAVAPVEEASLEAALRLAALLGWSFWPFTE